MDFLTVSNISYTSEQGTFSLNDISFTQNAFQNIAIAGETGSGKTTLMQCIAGLQQPSSGDIFFEGKRVAGPDWRLIPGHPGIGYLSQHFELRPHYRMEELLSYSNELSEEDAQTLYKICRIDHLMKRYNDELSGGEKQRIALARLLVSSPRLLILDEPFSNLDLIHKKILKAVLSEIGERLKISFIMASHDAADILPWADEILILQNGDLIQHGKPGEVYSQPVNEYAAALFGDYNLISKEQEKIISALNLTVRSEEKLFVRPEELSIADTGLKAEVVSVEFFGNYYKIRVDAAGLILSVNTKDSLKAGEVIYINHRVSQSRSHRVTQRI